MPWTAPSAIQQSMHPCASLPAHPAATLHGNMAKDMGKLHLVSVHRPRSRDHWWAGQDAGGKEVLLDKVGKGCIHMNRLVCPQLIALPILACLDCVGRMDWSVCSPRH